MDKPIFTLDWLNYSGLAANEKWTAVQTDKGISIYDHNGNLNNFLDMNRPAYTSDSLHIRGDELGYLSEGQYHIVSLPDMVECAVYDISEWRQQRIDFNEAWFIVKESKKPLTVWARAGDYWEIPKMLFREFVSENVFLGQTYNIELCIFDLAQRDIIQILPSDTISVSPGGRYMLTSDRKRVQVRSVADGHVLFEMPSWLDYCFCPGTDLLLVYHEHGHVMLYQLDTGDIVADYAVDLGFEYFASGFQYLTVGPSTLTVLATDANVHQYDMHSGTHLIPLLSE